MYIPSLKCYYIIKCVNLFLETK